MKTALRTAKFPAAVAALGLALLLAAPALAQTQGRVTVVLTDPDGKPLAGAKITVTTPELTRYREDAETNKRGQATIGFADSTKTYTFHIEAEGFPPVDVPVNPQIGRTLQLPITLLKGGTAATGGTAPADGGAQVRYTPVEQAYNRGVEAMRASDWANAEKELLAALEIDPDYASALYVLSGVYLQMGRHEDAVARATRYTELAPQDPQGQRVLFEAHQALGHTQEADAALSKMGSLDASGDAAAIFYNEGVNALKTGNVGRAETLLAKALEVRPDLEPALTALGIAQLQGKKYAAAAATAEKLLALKPDDAKALRMRWDAYRNAGDEAKAAEAFTALAAVDPKSVGLAFFDQGVAYFEQGQMPDAKAALEKAVELAPDNARAHYFLGMTYVNLEQPSKAKVELQKFVELAPNDPEAANARDMIGYLK